MEKTTAAVSRLKADKKIFATIDLQKVSTVSDVSLGDTVTLTVTGRVVGIRGPEESLWATECCAKGEKSKERAEVYPGSLRVEVSNVKVGKDGEFDGMMEDE